MTVLSDVQIIEGLISGQVICRPLRPENIRSSSIDLTLGLNFWRCDARPGGVFNAYDEDEITRYFAGPFQAKPYADVYQKIGWRESGWPVPGGVNSPLWRQHHLTSEHPFKNIPEDWPVIVLRPRERILAHCHEFVGIKAPRRAHWDSGIWMGKVMGGTSMMKARSSSGRVGFKVCDDAGWGDVGFFNRWTMEMRNDNDEAIIIPVGERVAQLVFMQTDDVREGESYGAETLYESKYQDSDDLDAIIDAWTPEAMLPRSFRDSRQPLLPLDAELYARAIDDLRSQR